MFFSIISGILSAVITGLIFILLKEKNNTLAPLMYQPIHYMSFNEFHLQKNKKWVNYYLFIYIPPVVVSLLQISIIQKYSQSKYIFLGLFCFWFVYSLKNFNKIIRGNLYSNAKFLLCGNTCFLFIIFLFFKIVTNFVNFSILSPSITGLVDSMWSTLFVALLIMLYLKITNLNSNYNYKYQYSRTELKNEQIKYIQKSKYDIEEPFGTEILKYCKKYNCSIQLLYAILIYENLNRPKFFRVLENLLVRIPKCSLTVGIAQVYSDKPLSDMESIKKAIEQLGNTNKSNQIDINKAIYEYNNQDSYVNEVKKIYHLLSVIG